MLDLRSGLRLAALCLTTLAACSGGNEGPGDAPLAGDGGPVDSTTGLGDAATDTGPDDTGPIDMGMEDSGPNDRGSVDVPPVDGGPADTGPTDVDPGDGGPTDTGPADNGPADTDPTDTDPADNGPADNGPADMTPVDVGPADGPTDTGPGDGPTDTGPTDGPTDTGPNDGPTDTGPADAPTDTGPVDGPPPVDAGPADAPPSDGPPTDVAIFDGGTADFGRDATVADVNVPDLGPGDAGPADADDAGDAGPVPPPSAWTWSRGPRYGAGTTFDRRFTTKVVWGAGRAFLPYEATGSQRHFDSSQYWPEADAFEPVGAPGAQVGAFSVWTGSMWLVAGGASGLPSFSGEPLDRMVGFDPATEQTIDYSPMPGKVDTALFVGFDNQAFIYGGSCGNLIVGTCFDYGAVFNPVTAIWTPTATLGAPPPVFGRAPVGAWTGSEIIVWYGSGSPSAKYNPITDSWSPIAQPSFTVGADQGVWTGEELFVWSRNNGAGLYNPATDTWRSVTSIGAPVSAGTQDVVWVDGEVIVLAYPSSAHYDITTDTWEPVNSLNAATEPSEGAVWSGKDVLYFTQTYVMRYGPRLAGNAACDGVGTADLSARLDRPVARRTVVGVTPLNSTITNNFSLTTIEWKYNGVVIASGLQDTTFDFSTLPVQQGVLTLEASDAFGNTVCVEREIDIGRSPQVQIVEPEPLEVATPMITLEATCTDDTDCRMVLDRTGVANLAASAPGVAGLVVPLDLSADDGGQVDFTWSAQDSLGFRTAAAPRTVLVRANPALVRRDYVAGEVCDASESAVLYLTDAGEMEYLDLSTSLITTLPAVTATLNCPASKLVPGGGALIRAGSDLHYWNGTIINDTWRAANFAHNGDFVASVLNPVLPITLRNLALGTSTTFGTNVNLQVLAVSPNGDVIWQDTTGQVFRHSGTTDTLLATRAVTSQQIRPLMSNDRAVWRFYSSSQWSIQAYLNAAATTLSGPSTYSPPPVPYGGYDISGSWIAYEAPDLSGATQVWITNPAGAISVATGFVDTTRLLSVGADGSVVYDRGGIGTYRSPAGVTTAFGPAGTVWRTGPSSFSTVQGRVLFSISP